MTAVPQERTLALAVVAVLSAALGAGKAGYGTQPVNGGWQSEGAPTPTTPFAGYAVVWPGTLTESDGPVSAPGADAMQEFQVTSVGASAEQADNIRDRSRLALLTAALVVTGRAVGVVELVDATNVTRDFDVTPNLFYSIDRFAVMTSPA